MNLALDLRERYRELIFGWRKDVPSNRLSLVIGVGQRVVRHIPQEHWVDTGRSGCVEIDEDMIDNGMSRIQSISTNPISCSDNNDSRCVNDDIADPGVREKLFARGNNVTGDNFTFTLPTGQDGEEGIFKLTNADPQFSQQGGPDFTVEQLWESSGPAGNENDLDKIDGVDALSEQEILDLVPGGSFGSSCNFDNYTDGSAGGGAGGDPYLAP